LPNGKRGIDQREEQIEHGACGQASDGAGGDGGETGVEEGDDEAAHASVFNIGSSATLIARSPI